MKNTPVISISFFFTGDYFDLDKVSSAMNIIPTETRISDSFKITYFAHTEWSIEIIETDCRAVSVVFEKLIDLLKDKKEIIRDICSKNIEVGFTVVIHQKKEDSLEIVLSREIINFSASIEAEIGFDLYYYD